MTNPDDVYSVSSPLNPFTAHSIPHFAVLSAESPITAHFMSSAGSLITVQSTASYALSAV